MQIQTPYIYQAVQIKEYMSVDFRDVCLLKSTLGTPKKIQYITRAEGLWLPDFELEKTKATKTHI